MSKNVAWKWFLATMFGTNIWKFPFGQFFARKISEHFRIPKMMEFNWNQYRQLPLDFCFDKNGRHISICVLVMNKTMTFFSAPKSVSTFSYCMSFDGVWAWKQRCVKWYIGRWCGWIIFWNGIYAATLLQLWIP